MLTQVLSERANDDGTTTKITVADRIIEAVRAGTPLEGAAASGGITNDTLWRWIREGAKATRLLTAGTKPKDLTAEQRRLAEFSEEIHRAAGEWEANSNLLLERLARGGTKIVTVTEKVDAAGTLIDRTTKTETLGPSPQVLQWRLSRRFPQRYADRVEVTGAGGEPISVESRAKSLADGLRTFLDGATAQRELDEVEKALRVRKGEKLKTAMNSLVGVPKKRTDESDPA